MKNILVGIDFDDNSELLIQKAVELAEKFNAKIWLLHVAAPEPDFVGYGVGPQYIRDSRAEELKDEHKKLFTWAEELEKRGLEAEGLLVSGVTAEEIIEKSRELAIDLIVAGYHDRSFLYNAFFGSTSSEIIKNSEIPVLIVPFGED